MAEQNTEKTQEAGPPIPEKSGLKAKILPMSIIGGIVAVFALTGFLVGRMFGTRGQAQTVAAAQPADPQPLPPLADSPDKKDEGWFFELEPVVVNLNEPGVTRYVRISLTLEVTSGWLQEEAKPILDQKKPLLKHWLTLYLSNQTIEDTRGKTNLVRMQSNISDIFNEGLFPNSQPRILNVLFKEFAIQ
jgi:flagellar basal body-associated protein FliL